ncbi:MAG: 50S ribosomal protein L29 [Candidatus Levybacteria bacterium]|nr:50S ribosomal protein L29 [Candidatus Levybacteria bacterium]
MKIKEKKELHHKTAVELKALISQAKDELAILKMSKKRGKIKNTSALLHKRKDIARMYSILRERQLDENA